MLQVKERNKWYIIVIVSSNLINGLMLMTKKLFYYDPSVKVEFYYLLQMLTFIDRKMWDNGYIGTQLNT